MDEKTKSVNNSAQSRQPVQSAQDPSQPVNKVATTQEEKLAEALFIAVGNNQIKLVEKLLDKGARTDWVYGKHTPMRLAAQRGLFPIVRLLHEQAGVSIKDDKRILHVTVLGQTPTKVMLDYLVEKGADVNSEDPVLGTPLRSALSAGKDSNSAKWLLELGAKKGSTGSSYPLHAAAKKGNLAKARELLDDGGKEMLMVKNSYGMVPLTCAAENGHDELVKVFIEEFDATPDNDSSGFTPLFLATQNNHLSTAKILIEAKADVNAVDKDRGASPIHLAASNSYLELMELLFENGAQPNVAESNGLTPMHMAVSEGLVSAVKVLLEHKADVHQKDGDGRTPILHSVLANHPWVSALLLQHGADVTLKDNNGMGPIDVVKEHSLGHMANMFQRFKDIDVDDKKTACGCCMGVMEQPKRCGRCRQLWYCSGECQKLHWSHHKLTCQKV